MKRTGMAWFGFAAGLLLAVLSAIATTDGAVTGSAIIVTVDKDGKTEVLVGKPTFNESQIITFLAALNPFLRPIPPMNRPTRSADDVFAANVTSDHIVMVAPSWWVESTPMKDDEYIAFILPSGLNSMTEEMKNKILSPAEGKRKIGLLMYPADISFLPNMVYHELFPLESMIIRDVRMMDVGMMGLKVNVFMDALGNARVGMYNAPWLILREVPEDAVIMDGQTGMERPVENMQMEMNPMAMNSMDMKPMEMKPMEMKPMEMKPMEMNPMDMKPMDMKPMDMKPMDMKPMDMKPTEMKPMEGSGAMPARRKRSPVDDAVVSGGVGTILLDKDGKVTWSVVPYTGVPPVLPPIPPLPAIPPIPFPDWNFFNLFNPFWYYPYWPFTAAQDAVADVPLPVK